MRVRVRVRHAPRPSLPATRAQAAPQLRPQLHPEVLHPEVLHPEVLPELPPGQARLRPLPHRQLPPHRRLPRRRQPRRRLPDPLLAAGSSSSWAHRPDPNDDLYRSVTRARGGGMDMYESYGAPMASSGALRPAPGLHMVTCSFGGADYPCAMTNATRFRTPRWQMSKRHCK